MDHVQCRLHLGTLPSTAVITTKVTWPLLGSCKVFLEATSRASYSFGLHSYSSWIPGSWVRFLFHDAGLIADANNSWYS